MRTITGTDNNDRLEGTALNDVLQGGEGDDTYVWGSGEGNDVVNEHGAVDDADSLILEGLNPDDILVLKTTEPGYYNDLIIVIKSTGERLILDNQFSPVSPTDVERFVFADGTVWTEDDWTEEALGNKVFHKALITTGRDDDTWTGSESADYIQGGPGDDTLSGRGGGDTYVFRRGDGIDSIEDIGITGTDRLLIQGYTPAQVTARRAAPRSDDLVLTFAGTDDRITVVDTLGAHFANTIERIEFDDGTVWTPEDMRNQVVSAMKATGAVVGSRFAETYRHALGDGSYTITDQDFGNNVDRLVFTDVNPGGVALSRSGTDVVFTLSNGETVTLVRHLDRPSYAIERIEFDDGTVWTPADVLTRLFTGGAGDDTIRGLSTDDTIAGLAGADTLYGGYGDDTLDGGADADTLHGGHGDDTLTGGAGDDTLHGESDDDRLTGGAGDDTLHGGLGSDTYVFNRGDGADTIEDNGIRGTDRLAIHGYTPAQVTVSRVAGDSDDVVLTFAGTDDRITIRNTLDGSGSDTIERIEFDDGTVWTPADMRALLLTGGASDDTLRGFSTDDTITGLAGADTLYGGYGDDTLEGGADDDTLHGEYDDDTLTGGAGDDTLHGGLGSDTYVFNRGDGADTIEDNGSRSTDRLVIHGYTPAQVTVSRVTGDSDDVVLTFAGTEDRITIRNTLEGSRSDTIERIEFDDGTVWTPADVRALLLTGGDGVDTIRGFSTADTIAGFAGADTLWGLRGDDTLRGGAGDDVLRGGHDDDTLEGGADDDTLHGEGDDDRLTGAPGTTRCMAATARTPMCSTAATGPTRSRTTAAGAPTVW